VHRNLDAQIPETTCNAALPAGRRTSQAERFANVTYRQVLGFLARIDAARPAPSGENDESLGMVGLHTTSGGIRFRCWSSTHHVEIELWHSAGRCWMANAPLVVAQQVVLACPHLDQVFELLREDACDFAEVTAD